MFLVVGEIRPSKNGKVARGNDLTYRGLSFMGGIDSARYGRSNARYEVPECARDQCQDYPCETGHHRFFGVSEGLGSRRTSMLANDLRERFPRSEFFIQVVRILSLLGRGNYWYFCQCSRAADCHFPPSAGRREAGYEPLHRTDLAARFEEYLEHQTWRVRRTVHSRQLALVFRHHERNHCRATT